MNIISFLQVRAMYQYALSVHTGQPYGKNGKSNENSIVIIRIKYPSVYIFEKVKKYIKHTCNAYHELPLIENKVTYILHVSTGNPYKNIA